MRYQLNEGSFRPHCIDVDITGAHFRAVCSHLKTKIDQAFAEYDLSVVFTQPSQHDMSRVHLLNCYGEWLLANAGQRDIDWHVSSCIFEDVVYGRVEFLDKTHAMMFKLAFQGQTG